MAMNALSDIRAKEEEIEKKKAEVRKIVEAQQGRLEEEAKKLADIRKVQISLDQFSPDQDHADPTRKEIASLRKKIDLAAKDLKKIGRTRNKKEKEYKEAADAFDQKNKQMTQLIAKLNELITESERLRMKKLEELSKNMDFLL